MLSLRLLFSRLLNCISLSRRPLALSSSSNSTVISKPPKARGRSRYFQTCYFWRKQHTPKAYRDDSIHVDLIFHDQTTSTIAAEDLEKDGQSKLADSHPLSEKGFAKVSGSKLAWNGKPAHSLAEWNHLNSVSAYAALSPISEWGDTDVNVEEEEAFDWFGESPPVILTTGSNSIFLRRVLPGLKLIFSSRSTSPPIEAAPSPSLVQRIFAWCGRY